MSDARIPVDPTPTDWAGEAMRRRIRRRYASERRFKALGLAAILLSAGFLAFLLVTMMANGVRGFTHTEVRLTIDFPSSALFLDPAQLRGSGAETALANADFEAAIREAADAQYGPGSGGLFASVARLRLRDAVREDPDLLGGTATLWLPAASEIDMARKGGGTAAAEARYAALDEADAVRGGLNWTFLAGSDATDPTAVGIWGALKGSLLTMVVTLVLAFPIGVLSAVYLEEYAPRNRWTDMIEVSINNLAAVPSIIFGLLGLAIFLNFMHLPRSAPLVGGLTLALMTMPVIVIAGRNAIKSVPPSIRDGALAIGASPVQVVFHHVLPLALPGILTAVVFTIALTLHEFEQFASKSSPLVRIGGKWVEIRPEDVQNAIKFIRENPGDLPDGHGNDGSYVIEYLLFAYRAKRRYRQIWPV